MLDKILLHATEVSRRSRLHGPEHWARVASFGSQLCRDTPGADPHVVYLFAALHDTQRYTDGPDRDHGRRAAPAALDLQGALFEATDEQMTLLVEAIAKHADGLVSQDPTIGCC